MFTKQLQRIKNLYKLSGASQEAVDNAVKAIEENQKLMNYPLRVMGDGKAVFFDAGYEEEFKELEHKEKFGGIKKLFGL